MGKRGRRCKKLLNGLKEQTGYWKLKKEGQDLTVWRTQLGKTYERVVR